MDLGIRIDQDGPRTVPMLGVRAGDRIVVGHEGVRVRQDRVAVDQPVAHEGFGFMQSDVSSEKPQGIMVDRVADAMRRAPRTAASGCCGWRDPDWSTPGRWRPRWP